MLPDRVSNPGPLTYESDALPIALRGSASNVSKMIQANSLLLNFQMKSPCYLVTLSLESSDFQTFLKQYVILVPFGALITLCNFHPLQQNDREMIRQICNVKPEDTANIRSTELLARLNIKDLDLILKERRLRWNGHVERSNGAVKTAFDIQIGGKRGPRRPKMTWKQLT